MTEFIPENDVIITKNVKESATDPSAFDTHAAADAAMEPTINVDVKKKKKRGKFGIFRAALFMLRKRPGEKEAQKAISKQKITASKANWTKLVGSVRPLHLQEAGQSPTAAKLPSAAASIEEIIPEKQLSSDESVEEMMKLQKEPSSTESMEEITPPSSPDIMEEIFLPPESPFASSSSCSTMSQYASAGSLRDLCTSSDDEEGDPDEVFDAISGDVMIDAKAEEFIAQFYRQIQIQNTSTGHHHRNHSRGI